MNNLTDLIEKGEEIRRAISKCKSKLIVNR